MNFGPRFGFAYDFAGDHKTVVRGGFGAMYERIQGNDVYNIGPNEPFSSSVTFNNVVSITLLRAWRRSVRSTTPITVGSITGLAYSDYNPPVSYQYSIGVEREIGHQLGPQRLLRRQPESSPERLPQHQHPGSELLASLTTNSAAYNTLLPYPGYGTISFAENAGNGHYNGLQVSLNLKSGISSLNVAYTFSRAIDPSTGGDLYTVSNPYNRPTTMGPLLLTVGTSWS